MGTQLIHLLREFWWLPILWIGTFFGGVVLVRWLVLRIPADYFVADGPDLKHSSVRQRLLTASKNVAGVLLALAGLVMIVTPGPGLIAVLLGISLIDFPGKRHFLARFVRHPSILAAANRFRARHGLAPLTTKFPAPSVKPDQNTA